MPIAAFSASRCCGVCDRAFGHRLMMDRIVPGGVAQDISAAGSAAIVAALDAIAPRFTEIVRLYDDTPSLQDRTCNTGLVSRELVDRWAAGGHVGRASGRNFDARRDLAYPPYAGLDFPVPVYTAGDVDARVRVRIDEVRASTRMVRRLARRLAGRADRGAAAAGRGTVRRRRHRGSVPRRCPGLAAAGGRNPRRALPVARCHVRDASWFQWPLLEAAIANNIVADFPLCNKSFNCSYAGHDL